MITCNLMGGLGNQLFQIFTTISFSIKTTNNFFFSNIIVLDGGYRHTYWETLLFKLKPFLREIHIIKETNSIFIKDSGFNRILTIFKENGFQYNNIPLYKLMGQDTYLQGYFQSYKYFDSTFPTIYRMLNIQEQKKNVICSLGDIGLELKNTISIHFRLGDYKILSHVYPILELSYYEKAFNKIIQKTGNTKFNVIYFCEDKDLIDVLQIINSLKEKFVGCTFIRCPEHLKDWEQLLLMSSCKHNIIANSTFSWWGAYLNNHEDKIVCYPNTWFQETIKNNTEDLFPNEWLRILL
jgi:hypothetical protein